MTTYNNPPRQNSLSHEAVQNAAKFQFGLNWCVLDGTRLHTIATEPCVVWDASYGLVQLVDGNWLQKRDILGKRLVTQSNQLGSDGKRRGSEHTSFSGNLAERSSDVGTVDMSVQFANTCSTRSTGI